VRAAPGFAVALAATAALAQAPVADRKARALEFDEAQRAVEFTRKFSIEAAERVREAEAAAKEAAAARKSAEEAAAEARRRDETAQRTLAEARRVAAETRAAYQKAAGDFERLRRR
jgi:hypothetical protein